MFLYKLLIFLNICKTRANNIAKYNFMNNFILFMENKLILKCLICQTEKTNYCENLGKPICSDCWKDSLQLKTKLTPEIDQIETNLYLGNVDAHVDKEKLLSLGVTHIVTIGKELQILHPNDFTYKHIKVSDFPFEEISIFFEEVINFINEGKITFVHCQAGQSRSASFVIAYTMRTKGMSFEEAFQYVKTKRNNIKPNSGFIKQLQNFK